VTGIEFRQAQPINSSRSGKLGSGGFQRIGGVYGVQHDVFAEVVADGAGAPWQDRWAGERAHGGDGIGPVTARAITGEDSMNARVQDKRPCSAGARNGAPARRARADHLAIGDFEAGFLEPGNDFPDFVARIGRLDKEQCFHDDARIAGARGKVERNSAKLQTRDRSVAYEADVRISGLARP